MNIISKNLIKEFAKDINLNVYNNAYSLIAEHINNALTTIRQRNPYISAYELYVANEAFTGTEYFKSTLDIFLVLDAPQIELNYAKTSKNKFKNRLKQFWSYFKSNFRLFSSKKKKGESVIKQANKKALSLQDYDVEVFIFDLFTELTKLLYNKTNISIESKKLAIIGQEEFGVDINIYPVFITDEQSFAMYNINTSKKLIVNFKERFNNLQLKDLKTQGNFKQQVKIFNNLYWNIFEHNPNQVFIESLIFSCPNELFVDDEINTTIKLVNYLKHSTMQNKKSICDTNISLFKEPLNTIRYETAIKFINNLKIQ